ncbi:uncharacterized protein [Solanum lycopersicum]|uniref:uncharacterized protein n=1 Tax=Solanum lycopersicum TaxID=4081 RepID=UPI00374A016F
MLAISSPMISTNYINFGWLLEDSNSQQININPMEPLHSSSRKNLQHSDSNKFDEITINGGDHHQPDQTVKKLNHNASERDRRKKINDLYSSLRSLLPPSDHMKKPSIPSTISKILKYIPELQSEVERLVQKKEEFTSTYVFNRQKLGDFTKQKRTKGGIENSSFVISTSKLSDKEIVVQISTLKINKGSIGEAISQLEDEGLVLLNANSFETFEDRVFYTLHFQVEGTKMLAISSSSPPLFSTTTNNFGWLLEDLISHELTNSGETSNSSQKSLQHCDSNKFDQIIINSGDQYQPDQTVKKLNHNASERDRRKKINSLYSSLRSLLPPSDHTKKLSIPSTVSRILKYIPELQSEVERLVQKKEEFTSKNILNKPKRIKGGIENSSFVISTSELGDKEIVIQISTLKINKGSISEAISQLEDEGLVLLNATSFETFEDRVFYTLHFQVEGSMVVEVDMLRDKLSSYFENEENLL